MMDEWQPIETAPRDGSPVICWSFLDGCPRILVWKTNPRIVDAHNRGLSQEWASSYFGDPDESDDYEFAEASGAPTHWLPFKEPRSIDGTGGKINAKT